MMKGHTRWFGLSLVVFLIFTVRSAWADQLLVSGFISEKVSLYDGEGGEFVRTLVEIRGPQAMRFGPDGNLYVVVENRDRIEQYDGLTGEFLRVFVRDVPSTPEDESGGLSGPTGIDFGPDGHLYVGSFNTDSILRYDGATGVFLDVFVPTGSGGLDGPDAGIVFGPDGNLYVPSFFGDRIPRYDGTTGDFIDNFVPFRSGGLRSPRMLIFHTDGLLYVSAQATDRINRYDAVTGVFVGAVVPAGTIRTPTGMAFGPDGALYVASSLLDWVVRVDITTGEVTTFVEQRSGGLNAPVYILFVPDFRLRIGALTPGIAGMANSIEVSGATSGRSVFFGFGTTLGAVPIGGCAGIDFGISDARVGGRILVDGDGVARLLRGVPGRLSGATIAVQAFERETCRVSDPVLHTFP